MMMSWIMRMSGAVVRLFTEKWDEETAILSGDAMLTTSTMLLAIKAGENLASALDLFNGTAMNIYEGQQLDMDFEKRL